ncbi:hypothetical protein E0H22_15690 [Rhodopseudomonas boonkerdii]|uniref:hypothetical protein n=1 Tax=Rhodopseudomonas boonkerdii TaxID=475937 RepID=UPI001E5B90A6|nr:hypothetical protein [Rhodopseudomonas boonkerdii]UGV27005.1 hypothetical protein E0H22_15690 [Rhodopseudomonas boonkerdii]
MDPAADHTPKEAPVHSEERAYGAIVAGVIALLFLGFVVHAATLPPQGEAGKPPAASAGAPKAGH